MKETLKTREAFERYYAMGNDRNLLNLAKELKVAKSTAKRWSKEFNWQEQILLRDKKIADKVADKTDTATVSERAKLLNITKLGILNFTDNLKAGKTQVDTVSDFAKLIDVYLKLTGETPENTPQIIIVDSQKAQK